MRQGVKCVKSDFKTSTGRLEEYVIYLGNQALVVLVRVGEYYSSSSSYSGGAGAAEESSSEAIIESRRRKGEGT